LTSLLGAIRDQAVALKVEQDRLASASKRELDVLMNRMTTLVPLFSKAIDSQREDKLAIAELAHVEIELKRRLADAEKEVGHYRPLAIRLEGELGGERSKLERFGRELAEFELRQIKAQRRIEDLQQQVATAESYAQRTAETNSALSQKVEECEFAIETLTREASALQSEITALTSDVTRQAAEIGDLTSRLAIERDTTSRAQMELRRVQADFDQFRGSAESAITDFEGRERRMLEAIAQRDWQINDYETRHIDQETRIESLLRKSDRQREDLVRHLAHIANLESTNRHLLDTLTRHATSNEEPMLEAKRTVTSPPKLRAIKTVKEK
jgi:chromosome segregation ATPase